VGISDERYAQTGKQFGYDQPIYVQFWDYLTGVLQGDLGNSFVTKRPVFDEFLYAGPRDAFELSRVGDDSLAMRRLAFRRWGDCRR